MPKRKLDVHLAARILGQRSGAIRRKYSIRRLRRRR